MEAGRRQIANRVAAGERRVILATPRGFCAGVVRAIDAVETALTKFGAPVYVRRAIVHNAHVVRELEAKGAIFVQELDEVPDGAIVILSAHGSARAIKTRGQVRNLRIADAICPLVAKVHHEVENWYNSGRHILLIGHIGHPEIVGTLGQVPQGAISVISTCDDLEALELPSNTAVAYAVQTTFSVRDAAGLIAAIHTRFADVAGPRSSDICYATTNRQEALASFASECDLVLVIGDPTSSNARRLVEVARDAGCAQAMLVQDAATLPEEAIVRAANTIGITAAASTPGHAVKDVCDRLEAWGYAIETRAGRGEQVRFRPVALAGLDAAQFPVEFDQRISQVRNDVEQEINRAIGRDEGRNHQLADAMRYAAMGGGKRFRSSLVVAVSELVGGAYQHAIRVAAAIECVHAQSLVHDDLPCMDDDDLRRGKLALHRKFDEATAILAGDALLALAFEILAGKDTHPSADVRANLVLALAQALGQDGLAGGQMMDLYPPQNPTKEDVFQCEARKTGALIRFAVEGGAMLGTSSGADRATLKRFAENLGLVFQIRDDMLDERGDAAVLGKAVGKDAVSGRRSVTSLLGFQGAQEQARKLENACLDALEDFGPKASSLRDLTRFAVSRVH